MGIDDKIGKLFDSASVNDYERLKKISGTLANALANAVNQRKLPSPEKSPEDEPVSDAPDSTVNEDAEHHAGFKNGLNKVKKATSVVIDKTKDVVHNAATTVVKTVGDINEKIQGVQTRTLDKDESIEDVKDFLNDRQGSFTDSLDMDYKTALEKLCDDISSEFSNNIERYSDKVRALREDCAPLSKLAVRIEKLSGDVDKTESEIKGF